jgi:hypothetical protein
MDIFKLFTDIQEADPEFTDRISPRRAAIKNITSFGSKVAVAALPFAFSTLMKKAYGQTTTRSVAQVLNFALTAELLESAFYNRGVAAASTLGIPSSDMPAINIITLDETNHVNFLKTTMSSLGIALDATNTKIGTNITATTSNNVFDFSGGKGSNTGPFATAFTSYDTFLALAQSFEDNGVRAYKGQAPFLLKNEVVLTAALNIHSVEARHAAKLRRIRQLRGAAIKPWVTADGTTASGITGLNATGTTVVNAIYAGENLTTQAGVNIANIISAAGASEAFDEPLDADYVVTNIVSNFLRP